MLRAHSLKIENGDVCKNKDEEKCKKEIFSQEMNTLFNINVDFEFEPIFVS